MLIFENCSFSYDEDAKSRRPFVVGVRDREYDIKDNIERWNLVSLDEDEAREVYELLHKHFGKES